MSLAAAACDRVAISSTSPAATGVPAALSAEPVSVRPEFLPSPDCIDRPPFGIRILISFREGVFTLRRLRFNFIDLLGTRTLPDVIQMPTPTSNASSLPSASPVTMPGIAALPPLPISSPIPFFARFGCGILPKGTLVIVGEMSQTNGAMQLVEMKVGVQ